MSTRARWAGLFAAVVAVAMTAGAARAAELLMFRRDGCPYCARWERDVGPIYPKTEIGQAMPLQVIDLDRPSDQKIFLKSPVRYTPTFVIVAERREIARLEGFPGEDFFWGFLDSHFNALQKKAGGVLSPPVPSEPVHGTRLPP